MNDPLEKFRRKPDPSVSKPARAVNQPVDRVQDAYEAFKASARPLRRLDIRCVTRQGSRMPAYSVLHDVLYVEAGIFIGLLYQHTIIKMMGRNLGELVSLLQEDRVEWVQEFDPDKWGEPPNNDKPVILSIQSVAIVQGQPQPPIDSDARH